MTEQMAVSRLRPPLFKLREDVGDLEELKRSIKDIGVLEPLLVRAKDKHYEIVAGHRRWLASHEIGLEAVPCDVIEADDRTAFLIALQENIQRKQMDIIEEARAFYAFANQYGYGSMSELAGLINKSPGYVTERVRLLKLPERTLDYVSERKLSPSHAEELTNLKTEDAAELAEMTIKMGELAGDKALTRDQLRKAVQFVNAGYSPEQAVKSVIQYPDMAAPSAGQKFDPVRHAREQVQTSLSFCLAAVSEAIEGMPEGETRGKYVAIRYKIHQLLDETMRLNKELDK
jgi:ParB/RepB/Spo0J family partition protein